MLEQMLEELRKDASEKLLATMKESDPEWKYGEVMDEPYVMKGSLTIVIPAYDDGEIKYDASFIHAARSSMSDDVRNTLYVINCYGCMKKFGIRSHKRAIDFALTV